MNLSKVAFIFSFPFRWALQILFEIFSQNLLVKNKYKVYTLAVSIKSFNSIEINCDFTFHEVNERAHFVALQMNEYSRRQFCWFAGFLTPTVRMSGHLLSPYDWHHQSRKVLPTHSPSKQLNSTIFFKPNFQVLDRCNDHLSVCNDHVNQASIVIIIQPPF